MSKALRLVALFLFSLSALAADPPAPAPGTTDALLREANGLKGKGQFKDALELYRKVALDPQAGGRHSVSALQAGAECLDRLNLPQDKETFIESTAAAHSNDWRVLHQAALQYQQLQTSGFLIDGAYIRGWHRGGGRWISTSKRDRTRAMQWLEQARRQGEATDEKGNYARALLDYARFLAMPAEPPQQAWRLQLLTDIATLPPLEDENDEASAALGAPVDKDGNPVLHAVPPAFDKAASDGERMRWLETEAVRLDPSLEWQVLRQRAARLTKWFGVQTLADQPFFFRLPTEDADLATNRFVLHALAENETIAKLATGVKRFTLPDDHNPIALYRQVAAAVRTGHTSEAGLALSDLASIFENRRQYDKAAACLEERLSLPGLDDGWTRQRLNQITGNWGSFEPAGPQTPVSRPSFDFRFRNGRAVSFDARVIDVPRLLEDLTEHLKSNPRELDWSRVQIENLGWRLVQTNQARYIGGKAAEWSMDLEPRPNHFDRRVTVQAPLEKPGAYWITARMENGNTNHLVLWVQDTILVEKSMAGKVLLYVADAESGKPIPDAAIEAFGYRTEWKDEEKGKRGRNIVITDGYSVRTDKDGLATGADLKQPHMQWLYSATTADGRFAYVGFEGHWVSEHHEQILNDIKTYVMTDRPVYRPSQRVSYAIWISRVRYDLPPANEFAGRQFAVHINDPQGNPVLRTNLTADAQGGLSGDLVLDGEAKLGTYSLHVTGHGGGSFRVEEYKKPEFEVTVEAPEDPIALGDAFKAVVKARYYFGGPVSQGRVKWKVIRNTHSADWFPAGPWDWLYGRGYGWLGIDYPWYPGWERWGCGCPLPWWRPRPYTPPEVVAENTVDIGPDGTVQVPIDTAAAKEMFGNTDHAYTISVEVTDASRRTITGSGKVIAARKPFKVYAWAHRGYYRAGDTILASFSARRADGKPVAAKGKARLMRITYRDEKPLETTVQEWPVALDEDGLARVQMIAASAGQYRLATTLTDAAGHTIEGATLVTVRGDNVSGTDFRFNAVELVPEKETYRPGEAVRLLIQADRTDGTVLLFTRPVQGIYKRPESVQLIGKTASRDLPVETNDMPNFFVEAVTVHGGRVHTATREILVPPEKRVLEVTVEPKADTVKPGTTNSVTIRTATFDGKPTAAALVLTVYDKAVEYISGGPNVPEIREFFWKWRRRHTPSHTSNADRMEGPATPPSTRPMARLGIFGDSVADEEGAIGGERKLRAASPARMKRMVVAKAGAMNAFSDDSVMMEGMAAPAVMAPMAADNREDTAFGMPLEETTPAGDAPVAVRKEFADTAYWNGAIRTGPDGKAEVTFPMPENLGEWVVRGWAFGPGAVVGEQTAKIVTTKDLLVRLQAPRFFVEKDEVVLSGNIHNKLDAGKTVRAILELEGGTLEPLDKAERRVQVPANGEIRVDWRVKVRKEGQAVVRMKALAAGESDAMQMAFPVFVHGMLKTESWSGAIRPADAAASIEIRVPAERRPDQSLLEVRWSPTLAGAMVDALPYLAAYPYGCTEQTLNRFLPTVITRRILEKQGIDLEAVRQKRANLNAQERGDPAKRAEGWKRFPDNPVFDRAEIDQMARNGLARLADWQNGDGGWNWFPGWKGDSSPHLTAQIVHGLLIAKDCRLDVRDDVLQRGTEWLSKFAAAQVELLKEAALKRKDKPWKEHADNLDSLVYSVLVEGGKDPAELRDFLVRDRLELSIYGQSLLGLSLARKGRKADLDAVMTTLADYVEQDEENQTAWLRMNNNGYWWFWYGDEIEAHAAYLKLLAMTDPKGEVAPRLVKYLLNNRKHATYWKSTRDTAWCIEAMADFLTASGEAKPDMTVSVLLDGQPAADPVKVTSDNLFTIDNTARVAGEALRNGKHKVEVKRDGAGPVYFNAYLENFTLEDPITAAGLEVKVRRKLFKLVESDKTVQAAGSRGQAVGVRVDRYERKELKNGDELKSGDLVEVELLLDSKNDYEYLVVEDMKAAGFEAVEVRSGYGGNELGAYMEFRDEKVCLFLRTLARGTHSVTYRVRAEIPGRFSVMPAVIWGMYAPELRGNSNEQKIGITD